MSRNTRVGYYEGHFPSHIRSDGISGPITLSWLLPVLSTPVCHDSLSFSIVGQDERMYGEMRLAMPRHGKRVTSADLAILSG